MEITVAKYAGFCPGVRRAINMADEALRVAEGNVYTLGPIIHNPQVVEDLQKRGMNILPDDPDALQDYYLAGCSVVVRSHGIPPKLTEFLLERGANLVDATCPTVKKAQKAAMRLAGEGYKLFVIGNTDHPEVKAILGHVNGEAVVIKETSELKEWWESQTRKVRKVGLIAQTTVDLLMFRSLVDGLINEVPELIREVMELKIINTLCRNTLARQAEALQLALASDFVVVVGGSNSSNTEFLRKICESTGTAVVKVESADELDLSLLRGMERLAILGGASTPGRIVEEVRRRILA
ncbi:MAG: 4-hydroxy-3-methylbut-2-enyl diphosphate reductase [Actinomycetota bacterium]|nr:4-hydroxy-3-methylbut-2-enyl diphosphate reductase [Actinomycetota bacterium]MDD5665973.1 4-hydroxy-3-methylbut-2-enyl diphosphate reductase [Actinomycetota bacterium]